MPRRPLLPAVAWVGSVLILAGCAGEQAPALESGSPPTPTAPVETTTPTPEPAATVDPASVTCENLIPESVVEAFGESGWTYQEDVFRVGAQEIEDGIWCTWGDAQSPASDNVQIYGWAPLEPGLAADAQDELADQGWVREDSTEGVYVTENPDTLVSADAEGYGMTYLFGDGWVMVSHGKSSLLVIERPGD